MLTTIHENEEIVEVQKKKKLNKLIKEVRIRNLKFLWVNGCENEGEKKLVLWRSIDPD